MRNIILVSSLLLLVANSTQAQTTKPLKKVMELSMVGDGGANGGAVAYHAGTRRYYATIAGNEEYPLCVFDDKGELLLAGDVNTLVDLRGLWYNSVKKSIQGNGYGDNGWIEYDLDEDGIPYDFSIIHADQHQPNEQCAGSFNSRSNEVYFFDGFEIAIYDGTTAEVKTTMALGDMLEKSGEEDEGANEDYNKYVVIATGIKDKEIGLLNVEERRVELFSKAGKRTAMLTVPEDQALYVSFNMSYANGIWWFFDKDSRTWTGYK